MSQVIDEKVVEMRFDNSDFESNVKQSLSTLDKLKQSLDLSDSADSFKNVSKAASEVSFEGMSEGIEAVKVKFSALEVMATTVLANITSKAVDAGLALMKSFSTDLVSGGMQQYEAKSKAVQTIINATGLGIDQVDAALEKLIWFTDETSYSFSDMTTNIGKFTSMGIDLDDSVDAMMGISNWAAVSGQGINEASRAMYNLSQAMGIGAVKLQDWKSIENANMATREFKQQVIDTAKAMGTITDASDVTVENFSSTLSKGWFTSDVLLSVLKEYGEYTNLVYEQVDAAGGSAARAMELVDQLGLSYSEVSAKAFKAAQEARTFSDAVAAVQDAVKSQWSTLFESVFGNYEEAKVLWTDLANTLYDIFADPLAVINDTVKDALGGDEITRKEWAAAIREVHDETGIAQEDFQLFERVVADVAREHGIAVDEMIEKNGSFGRSLEEGWLTGDILNEAINNIKEGTLTAGNNLEEIQDIVNKVWNGDFGNGTSRFEKLKELGWDPDEIQALVDKGNDYVLTLDDISDAMLKTMGYSEEEIEVLRKIAAEADKAGSSLGELAEKASGRELLREGLSNMVSALGEYAGAAREAFEEVFGTLDSGAIGDFIERFHSFTEDLLDESRIESFRTRIENIASVIHTVYTAVKGVFDVISAIAGSTIIPVISGLIDIVMAVADGIGGLIFNFDQGGSMAEFFANAVNSINTFLAPVKGTIETVSSAIVNFINALFRGQSLGTAFKEAMYQIFTSLDPENGASNYQKFLGFIDNIKNAVSSVIDWLSTAWSNVVEFFTNIWDWISNNSVFQAIGNWFKNIFENIFGSSEDENGEKVTFLTRIGNAWNSITQWFADAWDWISNNSVIQAIGNWFKNAFESLFGPSVDENGDAVPIADRINTAWGKVVQAFADAWDWLTNNSVVQSISNGLKTAMEKIFGPSVDVYGDKVPIAERIGYAWEKVKKAFSDAWNWLKNTKVAQFISEKFQEIRESFTKGFSSVDEDGNELTFLERLKNGIQAVWDWWKNNGSTIIDNVKGVIEALGLANLAGIFNKIKNFISGPVDIVASIGRAINSFANYMNSQAIINVGKSALAFSGAIFLIAAALAVLTLVDTDKLMTAGLVLVTVAGLISIGIVKIMDAKAKMNGVTTKSAGFKGLLESIGNGLENLSVGASKYLKYKGLAEMLKAVAIALGALAAVVVVFSQMNLEQLAQGIGSVVVLLGSLAGAMALMSKFSSSSFSIGKGGLSANKSGASMTGLLGMAFSILILVQAVKQICEYPIGQLAVGIGGVTVLMAEVVAAMAILSKVPSMKFSMAFSLVTLAGTMLGFVQVFTQLKDLNLEQMLNGVIAVGTLIGAIAGLDLVGKFGNMKDLSEGIAMMGSVVGAFGGIIGIFAALNTIPGFKDFMGEGVETLISIVEGIGSVLGTLILDVAALDLTGMFLNIKDLTKGIAMLAEVIGAFGLISAAFGAIDLIGGDEFMISGVQLLVDMINGIQSIFGTLVLDTTVLTIGGQLGSFAGLTQGLLMLGEVIGGFAVIVSAFGALNLIPGFDNFINGGIDILVAIAGGIGEFVGTLVGSIFGSAVSSFTSYLPQVGSDLSEFMTNVEPFITGASKIDGTFLDSIGNLSLAMMEISGSNFITSVMDGLSWLVGGTDTSGAISKFVELGNGLSAFATSIEGVDFSVVEKAGSAAEMLTKLSNVVPTSGGLLQLILGEKDFENVDTDFENLGAGISAFCNSVSDITADQDTIDKASTAAQAIAALTEVIPNQNGLFQWITGAPDISNAGTDFGTLGAGVNEFCKSVGDITADQDTIDKASTAAEAIGALTAVMPNQNGLFQWITGAPDFTRAESDFGSLGAGVVAFCTSVESITTDSSIVEKAGIAAEAIARLSETTPNEGGFLQWITGEPDFESASEKYTSLGEGVTAFCNAIGNITTDADIVTKSSTAAEAIASLTAVTPNTGGVIQWITGAPDLTGMAAKFGGLGEGVASFCTAITGITVGEDTVETASTAAKVISALTEATPKSGGLFQKITGEIDFDNSESNLSNLGKGAKAFCDAIEGINISEDTVSIASSAAEVIKVLTESTPITGGLWQKIVGEQDLGKFGDNLGILGKGVGEFLYNTKTVSKSAVINGKAAAEGMIEIMNLDWPNTGGLITWLKDGIAGYTDFSELSSKFTEIGGMAQTLATSFEEVNTEDITNAKTAAEGMIGILTLNWPTDGGIGNFISSLFEGETNWDTLSTELPQVGTTLRDFATNAAGIDTTAIANAETAATTLTGLITTLSETYFGIDSNAQDGIAYVGQLSEAISDLVSSFTTTDENTDVSGMLESLSSIVTEISTALNPEDGATYEAVGSGIMESVKKGIDDPGKSTVTDAVEEVAKGIDEKIREYYDTLTASGTYLMEGFGVGMNDKSEDLVGVIQHIVGNMWSKIEGYYTAFEQSGIWLMAGLQAGIEAKAGDVIAAGAAAAAATITAINTEFAEASPSKKTYESGKYLMIGLENGIYDYADLPQDAATDAASQIVDNIDDVLEPVNYDVFSRMAEEGLEAGTEYGLSELSDFYVPVAQEAAEEIATSIESIFTPIPMSAAAMAELAGNEFAIGWGNGIIEYADIPEEAAYTVAEETADAIEEVLEPVNYDVFANMAEEGWDAVISEYSDAVSDAAEETSESVAEDTANAMASVLENIDLDDLDASPTITPVLDLSEVEEGAEEIDDILNADSTISLSTASAADLAAAITKEDIDRINEGIDQMIDKMVQNNTKTLAAINDTADTILTLGDAINGMQVVMNSKALVGAIAADMEIALAVRANARERGII